MIKTGFSVSEFNTRDKILESWGNFDDDTKYTILKTENITTFPISIIYIEYNQDFTMNEYSALIQNSYLQDTHAYQIWDNLNIQQQEELLQHSNITSTFINSRR